MKLLNLSEHRSCFNYQLNFASGFTRYKLAAQECGQVDNDSCFCILFLLKGELLVDIGQEHHISLLRNYYPHFSPETRSCNASVRSGVPLTQLLSPSEPSYYGVIFLREERPLTPEVLTHWAETLSQPLFGQPFSCTLAQVPSRQEAMEQFENEMRLTR